MEIVDHPQLVFGNDAEAVEKIVTVLASQEEQEKLRAHLAQGSQRFSPTTFMEIIRRLLAGFLERQSKEDIKGKAVSSENSG